VAISKTAAATTLGRAAAVLCSVKLRCVQRGARLLGERDKGRGVVYGEIKHVMRLLQA
jgi:hypothetical protein